MLIKYCLSEGLLTLLQQTYRGFQIQSLLPTHACTLFDLQGRVLHQVRAGNGGKVCVHAGGPCECPFVNTLAAAGVLCPCPLCAVANTPTLI